MVTLWWVIGGMVSFLAVTVIYCALVASKRADQCWAVMLGDQHLIIENEFVREPAGAPAMSLVQAADEAAALL